MPATDARQRLCVVSPYRDRMAARRSGGCTLYVAAAGYGKTRALTAPGGHYRHAVDISEVSEMCGEHLAVDCLEELPEAALERLAGRLHGVPDGVGISLASRRPLSRTALAALPMPVRERDAGTLALSAAEIGAGRPGPPRDIGPAGLTAGTVLAHDGTDLRELTAGWPALVAFAREATDPKELTDPDGTVAAWLRAQVLGGLPPAVRDLLEELAALGVVSLAFCTRDAPSARWLRRTGLLVPAGRGFQVVPLLAKVLGGPRKAGLIRAAGWYRANGDPINAAHALHAADDLDGLVPLLEEIGDRVPDLLAAVPAERRTPHLRLLLGDARRMAGDPGGALDLLVPLLTAESPPGLLWRAAMAHYMRSEFHAALQLCDAYVGIEATKDGTILEACRACTLAMLGDTDEARRAADRALSTAACDQTRAWAHLAGSMTTVGGRREKHLTDALAAAERADDRWILNRVLLNQVTGLLREARYAEAREPAERAVANGGPPGMLIVALCNASEAALRLGRYPEAAGHIDRAIEMARPLALHRVAMGLLKLGDLHRALGHRERSRTAYEEAAELSRSAGERQVLIPALAGLARAGGGRAAAEEAERLAAPLLAPVALAARGWVALAEGDLATARERGTRAVAAARASRRVDCLAEALELIATASTDLAESRAALTEAEALWRRGGAGPDADRMLVLLGRLPDGDGEMRAAATAASRRIHSPLPESPAAPVRIRVLGGFEVHVGPQPVPLTAWRSRQARSLLKILVARRGRPAARAELCELLWPDDAPQKTGHRLSVLLSSVRTALDPARAWPVDQHVEADGAGLWLCLRRVAVDCEQVLRDAELAERLVREKRPERAAAVLAELDSRYTGDAFEDEPYADWARGLREEVRTAWLRSLRLRAELAASAGDPDQAVACLVRLRAADPFDEPSHRRLVTVLVRAGRHGEARRAFGEWAHAMRTIDAPPPDPRLLKPSAAHHSTGPTSTRPPR